MDHELCLDTIELKLGAFMGIKDNGGARCGEGEREKERDAEGRVVFRIVKDEMVV